MLSPPLRPLALLALSCASIGCDDAAEVRAAERGSVRIDSIDRLEGRVPRSVAAPGDPRPGTVLKEQWLPRGDRSGAVPTRSSVTVWLDPRESQSPQRVTDRHIGPTRPIVVRVAERPAGATAGWLRVATARGPATDLEPSEDGSTWIGELPNWALGSRLCQLRIDLRQPADWVVESIAFDGPWSAASGPERASRLTVLPDAVQRLNVEAGPRSGALELEFLAASGLPLADPTIVEPGESATLPIPDAPGATVDLVLRNLEPGLPLDLERLEVETDVARPNLVLVVIDTLRGDHVDPRASGVDAPTPQLARLASKGVAFERAFSHSATTLPSHTSLFSGRLPAETGVTFNGQAVPADLPLLAEWLRGSGYHTRALTSIGVLGPAAGNPSLARGFDVFDDDLGPYPDADWALERIDRHLDELARSEAPFFFFLHVADPHAPYRSHEEDCGHFTVRADGELIHRGRHDGFATVALDFDRGAAPSRIVLDGDEPFAVHHFGLYAGAQSLPFTLEHDHGLTGDRHTARLDPPMVDRRLWMDAWIAEVPDAIEARKRYRREVEFVDRAIGGALERLESRGLMEHTLTVVTSDHGEGLGDHGVQGHGPTVFDEQIHVPLIMVPPAGADRAALAARSEGVVSHVDVTATILDLLSLPDLPDQRGVSLLAGQPTVHVAHAEVPGEPTNLALRDEDYKLVLIPDDDRWVLFDLRADPGETIDLLRDDPAALESVERGHWRERLTQLAANRRPSRSLNLDTEAIRRLAALGYLLDEETAPAPAAGAAPPIDGDR